MEGAVLLDDGTTGDADDLAVGVGLTDDAHGLGIEVGLGVCRHKNGTIYDQIVGVGGGETRDVSDGIADHTTADHTADHSTAGYGGIIDGAGKGEL